MKRLNLPTYSFKIKPEQNILYIFDKYRKKYIRLTPEEWVRQNLLCFLEIDRGYPASRMVLEKSILLNNMPKRADILVYDSYGEPVLLVECKSYKVVLNDDVFRQVSSYNIRFKVKYLVVSNGLKHYCCFLNFETSEITFLDDIPKYDQIDPVT